MTTTTRATRLPAVIAGTVAILVMGTALSACGSGTEQAPSTPATSTAPATPTSATATPSPVEPTTKELNPTGGNLFTPEIKAPPAPTEPPGVHRNPH